MDAVIKTLQEKSSRPDDFTGEFRQIFKEELIKFSSSSKQTKKRILANTFLRSSYLDLKIKKPQGKETA